LLRIYRQFFSDKKLSKYRNAFTPKNLRHLQVIACLTNQTGGLAGPVDAQWPNQGLWILDLFQ
jgi:hypothetical protein